MLLLWLPALAGSDDVFPEMGGCLEAGNHTQFAINLCESRRSRVHLHQLKMYEERLGWKGDTNAFSDAVRTFGTFQDERCRYLGSFWKGGSAQPMIITGCTSSTSGERSERLQAVIAGDTKARPWSEADADLNTLWKARAKGDDALLAVQRAWLAYRDAQCTWEASIDAASKDACLSWHTDRRTKQIELDLQR